jgi:polyphosphate kinase 2 (PPK2 family)
VDLSLALEKDEYKQKLAKYQDKLQDLAWQAYRQDRSVVAVFEGWDAAGKGSAIRRVTAAMDPRLYRLVQFAAPTDEEKAHHYLWRFWRQLQRDGRTTFFDRSWYGRVLVERVENFAREDEWYRAYSEINQFERQLVKHGCIVLKFWIHISKDEQERRFKARETEPHKQHKITEEDWRNREKWHEYELAVDQMVSHTSTSYAPWTLVAGNNKPYARVQILKTFCKAMKKALDEPELKPPPDPE